MCPRQIQINSLFFMRAPSSLTHVLCALFVTCAARDFSTASAAAIDHESSDPFISVDLWVELADHHKIHHLSKASTLQKTLDRAKGPIVVLIANNGDRFTPMQHGDETDDLINSHPKLIRLLAKNALYTSARLGVLPLGCKWQYHSHSLFGESKTTRLQELRALGAGSATDTLVLFRRPREVRVAVTSMRPHGVGGAKNARLMQLELLKRNLDHGLVVRINASTTDTPSVGVHRKQLEKQPARRSRQLERNRDSRSFLDYMVGMRKYAFVFSPPGNGFDCHRHWEALMMGTIPIVLKSNVTEELFRGLPVWIVDDYSEVRDLQAKYEEFLHPKVPWEFERLYAPWWRAHLHNLVKQGTLTPVTGG